MLVLFYVYCYFVIFDKKINKIRMRTTMPETIITTYCVNSSTAWYHVIN